MLKSIHFIFWISLLPLTWAQSVGTPGTSGTPSAPINGTTSASRPAQTAPLLSILPYATGQWKGLLQTQAQDLLVAGTSQPTSKRSSQPVVVHFWGVTCGPCLTEMPQWGRFVNENRGYKEVFVQVDDVSTAIMSQLLSKAHLSQAVNYKLTTPFDEFMRYEVDAKWEGETPFTILVNASGQTSQMSGLVNFAKLKKWLQQNS